MYLYLYNTIVAWLCFTDDCGKIIQIEGWRGFWGNGPEEIGQAAASDTFQVMPQHIYLWLRDENYDFMYDSENIVISLILEV